MSIQKKKKPKVLNKLVATLLFLAGIAHAQEYKMVVPFGPGSQTDSAARQVAIAFERNTGHKIVVETIPGADSITGINHFKASNAEIVWLGAGPLVYNPVLKKDLPYDPVKDFDHVMYVGTTPFYYIVGPNSKIASVKDLINKPPEFAGVNTAVGSANILALNREARSKIQTVPFKGSPDVILAVANGTIEMGIVGITTGLVELAKAGKITIIGTTHREATVISGHRVASVTQQTGIPQFSGFFTVALRPGLDPQRAAALRQNLWAAVQDPESQEVLRRLFVFADASNDVKQITNYYQEQRNRYRKVQNEME